MSDQLGHVLKGLAVVAVKADPLHPPLARCHGGLLEDKAAGLGIRRSDQTYFARTSVTEDGCAVAPSRRVMRRE